jgi:hypothetical protein
MPQRYRESGWGVPGPAGPPLFLLRATTTEGVPLLRSLQGWEPRIYKFRRSLEFKTLSRCVRKSQQYETLLSEVEGNSLPMGMQQMHTGQEWATR